MHLYTQVLLLLFVIYNQRSIKIFYLSSGPRRCYPGDVRRINVTYSSMMVNREYLTVLEGSFEQCIGGYNGPVCDIGWDDVDATVLCRRIQSNNYGRLKITVL